MDQLFFVRFLVCDSQFGLSGANAYRYFLLCDDLLCSFFVIGI